MGCRAVVTDDKERDREKDMLTGGESGVIRREAFTLKRAPAGSVCAHTEDF